MRLTKLFLGLSLSILTVIGLAGCNNGDESLIDGPHAVDFSIIGTLEYAKELKIQLTGIKKEDVTISWHVDLTNADGINNSPTEIPYTQGGSGDSLSYFIGTYQYAISDLGLSDLNGNGIIDDKDWEESGIKDLGALPAQFFIGKDVKVCVQAHLNSEAEGLIGIDPICKWASEFTKVDGERCDDPLSCVSGGIIANNAGDIRIEPVRLFELAEGVTRIRTLSYYELPVNLQSKVKMERWNGIDWLRVPVGGSEDLGLDNDATKQLAVDICKLDGGFLPIADLGFANDLGHLGNEASADIALAPLLLLSSFVTNDIDNVDFYYNGPITGQYANDFVSASVQGDEPESIHPGVTYDVWVDVSSLSSSPESTIGNVVRVGPETTSSINCIKAN